MVAVNTIRQSFEKLASSIVLTKAVKPPPCAMPVEGGRFVPAKTVGEAKKLLKQNMQGGKPYESNTPRFSMPKKLVRNLDGVSITGHSRLSLAQANETARLVTESSKLADIIGVPRLRGLVMDSGTAKMGDGVMHFGPPRHVFRNGIPKAVQEGSVSKWKRGMDVNLRPFNAGEYARTDIDELRHTFWHEFGHHIHQQKGVGSVAEYMSPPLEKKVASFLGGSRTKARLHSASKYSETNAREWFAENFSLYQMGRTDLLDKDTIAFIEKVLRS